MTSLIASHWSEKRQTKGEKGGREIEETRGPELCDVIVLHFLRPSVLVIGSLEFPCSIQE